MENKQFDIKRRSITFRALYYWEKIIGINPLSISKSNELEFSYIGLFYGCILSAIYSFIFYRALIERLRLWLPNETPIAIIVDYMGMTWQFFDTSLSWLVFAFYQNRVKVIVKSFVKAEDTSIKLGIPEDYDRYFREFGTFVTINNIVYVASLAFSVVMWSYYETFDPFLWTNFCLPPIVSFNMQILFVWSLTLVKKKFHRLNEKVKFLMQNDYPEANEANVEASPGFIRHSSRKSDLLADRINLISQLHRELRDVLSRIEEHFALILTLSILDNFTYITLDIYATYRYIKIMEGPLKGIDFIHMGAVSHWILCDAAMLIVISNICGSTVHEANNTGNILHAMLNNCQTFGDTREDAKFNVLSLDLLQNRVTISLWGFLYLDHFFIYSTISTATTYWTIMLQFYS